MGEIEPKTTWSGPQVASDKAKRGCSSKFQSVPLSLPHLLIRQIYMIAQSSITQIIVNLWKDDG
jgi:hypothetical protein